MCCFFVDLRFNEFLGLLCIYAWVTDFVVLMWFGFGVARGLVM